MKARRKKGEGGQKEKSLYVRKMKKQEGREKVEKEKRKDARKEMI